MIDDQARPAPSHAAILGHPIHPMLVPLPIGALVGALASDLLYMRTRDAFWARASTALLGAGLATGAAAAPFGALDFATISRARRHPEGWIHAAGNVAALALTAGNLALRLRGDRRAVLPAAIALSATTAAILGLTGWMGGELSYRYRIGVMADEATTASSSPLHLGTPRT